MPNVPAPLARDKALELVVDLVERIPCGRCYVNEAAVQLFAAVYGEDVESVARAVATVASRLQGDRQRCDCDRPGPVRLFSRGDGDGERSFAPPALTPDERAEVERGYRAGVERGAVFVESDEAH